MSADRDLNALIRDARGSEDPSASDRALVRRALALRMAALPELAGAEREPLQLSHETRSGRFLRRATSRTAITFAALPVVALSVWWSVSSGVSSGVSSPALNAATEAQMPGLLTWPDSARPPEKAPGGARGVAPAPVPKVHEVHEVGSAASSEVRVPSGAKPTAPPRSTSAARAGHNLAAESRALASVQRALRDADPRRALGLLDEQDRVFAQGVLGEERVAARVLALCDTGDVASARRTATAFLEEHASSPLRARVAASCVGSE